MDSVTFGSICVVVFRYSGNERIESGIAAGENDERDNWKFIYHKSNDKHISTRTECVIAVNGGERTIAWGIIDMAGDESEVRACNRQSVRRVNDFGLSCGIYTHAAEAIRTNL